MSSFLGILGCAKITQKKTRALNSTQVLCVILIAAFEEAATLD